MHVGLDPQHAARVEHQAVGAGEEVAVDVAPGLGPRVGRVAGEHEVAPAHRGGVEVALFFPADDLAHHVVGARVGSIDPRQAVCAARAVVGERAKHFATLLIDRQPLGPVHLGGAERVARLARLDQHFALIGKTVRHRERPLAVHQRQPAAAAIGVETCDVKRAVVEQLAVRLGLREAIGGRCDAVAADEFVDVFEARVFARIHDRAAIFRDRDPRAFVRGAAERGALDRRALRVHRVDLDDPAEAVELVRVFGGVEAFIVFVPAVERGLAHAPALLVRVCFGVANREVVREVLFARQVGAPGRLAAGAVVERAEHRAALGVGRSFHHGVAGRRPAERKRGAGREAARVGRGPNHVPAGALALDLDHRHAVRGLRLLHFLGTPVRHAGHMQQAVVDVLVVHREQAARAAAGQGVVVNAVVVHAHLQRLIGGTAAPVFAPRRHVAGHADRLAPGCDGGRNITLGHHERVGRAGRYGLEAKQRASAGGWRCTTREQRRQRAAGECGQATVQPDPACRVGNAVDVGVGRPVAVFHRVEIFGHGLCLRQSFSVSLVRGCHFIKRFSMRPTAPSSSSANTVSTRMPAITVLMSNAPSACRIR